MIPHRIYNDNDGKEHVQVGSSFSYVMEHPSASAMAAWPGSCAYRLLRQV